MNNKALIQVKSLNELAQYGLTNIVAAIGVFDGIHLGHRKIIHNLIEMAEKCSSDPVIITFHPHPRKVLLHNTFLRLLRNLEMKDLIMEKLGIKAIVTVPFTSKFASLPPKKFIKSFMMPDKISLKGICVGSKWKFGSHASGNQETLHNFADQFGFYFCAVNEVYRNNKLVSSTAIRKALKKGDFDTANYMLDSLYSIKGKITKQQPACNNEIRLDLFIEFGILPPCGEYSIYVKLNGNKIKAYSEVTSEETIQIFISNMDINDGTLEFEFIEKTI